MSGVSLVISSKKCEAGGAPRSAVQGRTFVLTSQPRVEKREGT